MLKVLFVFAFFFFFRLRYFSVGVFSPGGGSGEVGFWRRLSLVLGFICKTFSVYKTIACVLVCVGGGEKPHAPHAGGAQRNSLLSVTPSGYRLYTSII